MDVKKTRDCRLYKSRRNETDFLTVEEALRRLMFASMLMYKLDGAGL